MNARAHISRRAFALLTTRPDATIAEIQRVTSEFFGLPHSAMTGPRRARRYARPRQIAMWLARDITALSLPDIGARFGNRDHTTVMWAERRIESLMAQDERFRDQVHAIRAAVRVTRDDRVSLAAACIAIGHFCAFLPHMRIPPSPQAGEGDRVFAVEGAATGEAFAG
ncbi:MAG TPA: helix-turn-helix domain-containing protein [Rhizomicrobium sp.]|jgi:hypothetical protein|nr:helix-turn-helix domain-containing protein [Rhizomicrobium sp.]